MTNYLLFCHVLLYFSWKIRILSLSGCFMNVFCSAVSVFSFNKSFVFCNQTNMKESLLCILSLVMWCRKVMEQTWQHKNSIQRMPTGTIPEQSPLCDGTLHCSFAGSTSVHREGQIPGAHSPSELCLYRLWQR